MNFKWKRPIKQSPNGTAALGVLCIVKVEYSGGAISIIGVHQPIYRRVEHPLLSTFISHFLVAALLLFCIEIIVASGKFNFTQFDSAQI